MLLLDPRSLSLLLAVCTRVKVKIYFVCKQELLCGISCEFHIDCAPFTQIKFCDLCGKLCARSIFVCNIKSNMHSAHAQTINHKVIICVLQPSKFREKKLFDSRTLRARENWNWNGTTKCENVPRAMKYLCVWVYC